MSVAKAFGPGLKKSQSIISTSLLKPSIKYWQQGDQLIGQIIQLAEKLHQHIKAGETQAEQIQPLIAQINKIDFELTPLEEAFSNSISDASRKAQTLIATFMLVVTVIFMTLGILFSRRLVIRGNAYLNMIRVNKERWKFALDGARDGVWDWNIMTKDVTYSNQWKAMLGYEEDEL